jgi:hypothetical protein
MYDDEQEEHLDRVSERIGAAILEFFRRERRDFHADELRFFVADRAGPVAPGSPDRIMRDMRQRGVIDYRVVNRRQSLYEILIKQEV